MLKPLTTFITACGIALKRLFEEGYTYRASALAFTTLLALVPLLSVIVSLVSLFPFFTRFTDLARNYILTNFIPTSSTLIQEYLESFISQATHLPIIGLVFLFFTAVTLILTVDHTLNDIWHVPRKKKKFSSWLLYWGVLIISPLILGLSIFISTYVFSLTWFTSANKLGLEIPLLAALPLLINTLLFSLLYIIVPNTKVHFGNGLIGGLLAALLFEFAKKGFSFYILRFPSYELIYGALATIPIFLLWLYVSWFIILLGALFTQALHRRLPHL